VALLQRARHPPKQTLHRQARPLSKRHPLALHPHTSKRTEKLGRANLFVPGRLIPPCQTPQVAVGYWLHSPGVRSQRRTLCPISGPENERDKRSCSKSSRAKRGESDSNTFRDNPHALFRYVQELVKMKDTFIDPLLHPFSAPTPQLSSTPNLDYDYYRSESPVESNDHLPPIAARFMSPSPTIPHPDTSPSPQLHKDTPNIDGESLDTDEEDEGVDQIGKSYALSSRQQQNHPRSPYRSNAPKPGTKSVPFPTRSHHSLPPPPRTNQLTGSTHSLGRQTSVVERERNYSQGQSSMADRKGSTPKPGMLRKLKKSQTTNDSIFGTAVAPHQLPEDLRICLEVVDSGVFDGHKRLSEALKKRYDDQFPLVRSLADVFVSNVMYPLPFVHPKR
jgi:hypothetical protein